MPYASNLPESLSTPTLPPPTSDVQVKIVTCSQLDDHFGVCMRTPTKASPSLHMPAMLSGQQVS